MPRPLLIGVAGGTGSGKTTVARAIHQSLGLDALLLDQDAYYRDLGALPLAERRRVNFDHPDALDLGLMIRQLRALAAWQPVDKPTYDFVAHTRAPATLRIEPRDVILVEGILLFVDPELRGLFDIKIFVDVADDVRFIRRLQRDLTERGRSLDSIIDQYLSTVRPMHLEFVEPQKRYADIILPEGGQNRIGVEMIEARVALEIRRRAAGRAAAPEARA